MLHVAWHLDSHDNDWSDDVCSDPTQDKVHYVLLDAAVTALRWPAVRPPAGRGQPLPPQIAAPAHALVDYLVSDCTPCLPTLGAASPRRPFCFLAVMCTVGEISRCFILH